MSARLPAPALAAMRALAFAGRALKMHAIFVGQMLTAEVTGGGKDSAVKQNIALWAMNRYGPLGWKTATDIPMPPPPDVPGRIQLVQGRKVTEVQTQPAAHRPGVVRRQVGIDEVGKVRASVFAREFHERLDRGRVPVKILGHVDRGDWEGKYAFAGVTLEHHLTECAVEQVHFMLEFAVGRVHGFPADHGGLLPQF